MGIPQSDGKMEGWLYLVLANRFGQHNLRKRFFILKDYVLTSFKIKPTSQMKQPFRSAIIDSCIRVADNGRESISKKMLFVFTVYNASNQRDMLKLGASSSEEAARWIRSLQDAPLKECPNPVKSLVPKSKRRRSSLRYGGAKSTDWNDPDMNFQSCIYTEAMTSDVISTSPWKIFGCQNGLRMFKEAKEGDSCGTHWGEHPAIMAVGVIDGTSEAIFHTLMSLDPSRAEWDFCIYRGNVVEHLDGHTDIIHTQLYNDWLPWGMKRRELLLRRYWRREDDGTYVLLYHSVQHEKYPPHSGYVRACLKSGGFIVTPVNKGKQSVVKHMIAIDWKYWKLYLLPSSARSVTIRMLERVAALRELYRTKAEDLNSDPIVMTKDIGFLSVKEDMKSEVSVENSKIEDLEMKDEGDNEPSDHTNLMGLNDSDEFFDVPESTEYNNFENEWQTDLASEQPWDAQAMPHTKISSAAGLVKKLQDLTVQKKGYIDLHEVGRDESQSWCYGSTLQKDSSCALPCSWAASDPSLFLIRGETYLKDQHKVKAKGTLMQMVGADWLRSNTREDDLSSRPGSIVQQYAAKGGSEFFFVINIQMPSNPMYSLALYYMTRTPLEDSPLLQSFVEGDDAYRNSRFKLIPYISKGSWIVKQSVGKKACLVGQALEILYIRGTNYLELDINVGSSTVARGVSNLVLGYLNNLIVEMAFLIQGNTQDELPEVLIGTCRLNHMDASKSFMVKP
ncbi:PREDICTED: protein ENHANCED DISEASE RESISTANCE 2-like isoform X1 [Lupinus angustifolius]|uniref:protein ENHANCED DISEASE RESISTANCE 2-like isoform X1 n=1 Tax=Lupinus angustifolius TaxID=3871 RepID=UPI00092EEFF2|nr:PREDICTED: protein ENHANCED DISEASE RESISTANCE 2-like isoform X1 [Lupinus angustifolius]